MSRLQNPYWFYEALQGPRPCCEARGLGCDFVGAPRRPPKNRWRTPSGRPHRLGRLRQACAPYSSRGECIRLVSPSSRGFLAISSEFSSRRIPRSGTEPGSETGSEATVCNLAPIDFGAVPKRSKGAVCKTAIRRFKSGPHLDRWVRGDSDPRLVLGARSKTWHPPRRPGWRNGSLGALKRLCPKGRAGSTPAPGITQAWRESK